LPGHSRHQARCVSRPFHRKQYRGWSVTAQSTWQKSVASIIVAGVRTRGGRCDPEQLGEQLALLYDGLLRAAVH